MEEYLIARHDSRDSFNRKATLVHNGDITELKSFLTVVAEYNHKTNKVKVFGWFSTTTARHINEFLLYYGFDKVNKKDMETWDK